MPVARDYPRLAEGPLHEALADSPVTLIHGPRQSGKTTLARAGGAGMSIRWYVDYVQAIVERDVRDLARVQALDIMPRLITLAAGQTARLVNIAELSAPFQLSRQTIRDYVTLLQRVFLLEELPPWHSNRLSRLVKTSKLHIGDTGLAACLLGADAAALHEDRPLLGQLLETAGSAFRAGVVLYDGELGVGFGDRLFAVPINWLWETP